MKILYIAPYISEEYKNFLNQDGIGSLAATNKIELISKILCEMGHEVLILSSINYHSKNSKFKRSYIENRALDKYKIKVFYPCGIRYRVIGGIINIIFSSLIAKKVRKFFPPEIIISYNSNVFEYAVARSFKLTQSVRIVLEVEDLPLSRRRGLLNIKPLLDKWSWGRLLKLADGFTAVNPGIQLLLPSDKPCMLLPGVVNPVLEQLSCGRVKPFLNKTKILGYFGGLDAQKGVAILLELANQLPAGWVIYVCGSGELSERFNELAEHNCNLLYFGVLPMEKMYEIMTSCDVLFVPTENSANKIGGVFPFKIFEYFVSNAHIISPPIPYLDELNINFISRWDGSIEGLKSALINAKNDFYAEEDLRAKAIKEITAKYSSSNLKLTLKKLLDLVALNYVE
jgi:glycosyltransferase involved in cell wall biosynthesis